MKSMQTIWSTSQQVEESDPVYKTVTELMDKGVLIYVQN